MISPGKLSEVVSSAKNLQSNGPMCAEVEQHSSTVHHNWELFCMFLLSHKDKEANAAVTVPGPMNHCLHSTEQHTADIPQRH